jgi:hypothetical protein
LLAKLIIKKNQEQRKDGTPMTIIRVLKKFCYVAAALTFFLKKVSRRLALLDIQVWIFVRLGPLVKEA